MRVMPFLAAVGLVAWAGVIPAAGADEDPSGREVPRLVLLAPPEAVSGPCESGRPVLAGDGREIALVSLSRNEALVFDGRHVDRWNLELPAGSGRVLAPVAFSSREGLLALFAVQPPRLVVFRNGGGAREIPVETFPVTLAFERGELLVGLVPFVNEPERVGRPFVFLRSFSLTMERWQDLLTVEPPSWVEEEKLAAVGASLTGASSSGIAATELRLWASGLVAPRRDRKLWFVNRYDGTVQLLSTSGARLWSGSVPGVRRKPLPEEQRQRLEARLADAGLSGAGRSSLARLEPQVLAVAAHEGNLAVLHRDGGRGIRLSILVDETRRWRPWSLPAEAAPRSLAVLDDELWLAPPCRTVPWERLIGPLFP